MVERVSIVVPTYNRPSAVVRLLDALGEQAAAAEAEVVVVDDGSTEAGIHAGVQSRGHRYLRIPNSGQAVARNLGWQAAVGDIIVFVDDDVVPEADWLAELIAPFRDAEIVGVGGRIAPLSGGAMSAYVQAERLADHAVEVDGTVRYLVTANAAFRRSVLEAVGGFSADFPAGLHGEDVDLSYRVKRHGALTVVAGGVVRHEHRTSLGALLRTYRANGRGRRVLAARHPSLSRGSGGVAILRPSHWRERYARYRAAGVNRVTSAAFLALHAVCAVAFFVASMRPATAVGCRGDVVLLNDSAGVGGAERVTLEVAAVLEDLGLTVLVASPPGWLADRCAQSEIKHVSFSLRDPRTLHPRLRIPLLRSIMWRFADARAVRRLMVATGAHTLHTLATTAHVAGSIASLGASWRLVWHLNQIGPVGLAVLPLPDRCLAPSKAVIDALNRRSVLGQRALVAPNGVDLGRYSPASAEERRRVRQGLGIPEGGLVITCAARIEPLKGLHHLIEAASHVDGAVVLIAGEASGAAGYTYESQLRERAIQLGLDCRLLGRRLDVDRLLHASDVAAFPSLWEGFGLFAAEAGCSGVPVVGFATGGLVEVVVQGQTGVLVAPGDEHALASALQELAADPGLRKQMGEAAVSHCRQQFDGTALRSVLEEVYA